MNVFNRPGIYAGLTGLVLISATAAPAIAQTKTFPPGTDCSALSGADMTACQNQMSSQQRDGTVGNGAVPGTQIAPGGIGSGGETGTTTNGTTNFNTPSGTNTTNPSGTTNGTSNP
ncbi:MAG TPA: hypothetical protein VHA35_19330 [Dongiaceae bacterium]|nr:hypothetical protein [Dongiaceae bacterium]